jgi:AcrR family transcriptional regulator
MLAAAMATRRAQQKEATREQIYAVAMRLFDARGYEEVNIDEIVTASGVARGTFYFHFPRKDDLLLEAIRRGEEIIVGRMAAVSRSRTLRRVLEATTDAFAEVWGGRRALLPHAGAVALRRIAEVTAERAKDPLRLELVKHVARAIETGELRSPLPAQMLADVFLLDVFAALMAWAAAGEPSLDVVMPAVIDLFLHGVRR